MKAGCAVMEEAMAPCDALVCAFECGGCGVVQWDRMERDLMALRGR